MDVRYQKYTVEGEDTVTKEYMDVICPADLPRWIVLKTIQAVLKVNGSKGSARMWDFGVLFIFLGFLFYFEGFYFI
jgi:hypothetical protein